MLFSYIYMRSFLCMSCKQANLLYWSYLRMYALGKVWWNFYNLEVFFLFLAANWRVYNVLLKLTKWVLSLPPSDIYVRSLCYFSKNFLAASLKWSLLSPQLSKGIFFPYKSCELRYGLYSVATSHENQFQYHYNFDL